jgi:hypothetical protein
LSPKRSSSAASTSAASSRISRELLVGAVLPIGGVCSDPGAVDGDRADRDQAGLGAEGEHLAKEPRELVLVAGPKARDRRVVGLLVGGDHPEGDVLDQAAFDLSRGALGDRVGVEQQGDHWVVGRSAPAVVPVVRKERLQVHLRDGIENEPGEVVVGQPLAQVGRQEQLLVAVAREEVLAHGRDGPDRRGRSFVRQAPCGKCLFAPAVQCCFRTWRKRRLGSRAAVIMSPE